ncbi:hypothetical protein [Gordonia rubripertincta]|uniref:hypothetical protein n=1 Tax=Gordonia rubripertincta TaxID=36822 RepID=UPI0015FCCFD1|nr:hypothetical protein [Gordonia rubripertincta]QMU22033.1 hypothetical protein H3V45_05960 [Gordonia rubripertincta]
MADTVCVDCGTTYPVEPHTFPCPHYVEITNLENRITETIHTRAFVPLIARYRIARQLIADGWRPS